MLRWNGAGDRRDAADAAIERLEIDRSRSRSKPSCSHARSQSPRAWRISEHLRREATSRLTGTMPNRASSSCALSARGRSRSTSGRARTPRTVTSRNGRGSAGSRRFSASSNVLAVKAFTLMPRAAAARRTCFASRSSSEIVVLMMQKPNRSSSTHQCRRAGRRLLMIPPWYVIHVSSSPSLWQYRANLSANGRIETVGTRLGV